MAQLTGEPQTFATGERQTDGGLASVDLEIPERGAVFYFEATRGNVELTAQPVRDSSTFGLATVILCLAILAFVWVAPRTREQSAG